MTDIAPFFRLVAPPTEDTYGPFDTVKWVKDVIAKIDFPWWRCNPYIWRQNHEDDKIKIVWEPTTEDGLLGQWHRSSGTIRLDRDKWRRRDKGLTGEVALTLAHEIGHMVESATIGVAGRQQLLDIMHPVPGYTCPYSGQWSMPAAKTDWVDRHNEAYADFFVEAFAPDIWNNREKRAHHHRAPTVTAAETRRITLEAKLSLPFPDVPETHPFHSQIAWAYANGIITGKTDGTFGPNEPVTRGQLAVMMKRLYDLDVSQGGT